MRIRRLFSSVLLLMSLSMSLQAQKPEGNSAADLERGKQAINEHKYKDALEALKAANEARHNACGVCYFLSSIAYFHLHDQARALESCDKAIETADSDQLRALSHNLKGNLLLGSAAGDAKVMQHAEDEFQAAVKADPKTPVFHLNLAKALLRESKDDPAKQQLQECLDCAPDDAMKLEAQKLLARPERGREELAPDFQFTTLQGQQLSLQTLAGRVVVMDFWATWCPPCRESVPELKELTKRYPGDKLVVISVSADKDENAWKEFVAKKKMDWAQYRDAHGQILESFGIHSFPTYLVIDGDGVIKERLHGLTPQESVVHRLKAILGQMPQLEGVARK